MKTFNFVMTLAGVSYSEENCHLEDALFKAGCDDGIICCRGKSVYIEFDRIAASYDEAVKSATQMIESAGIGATVASVERNV